MRKKVILFLALLGVMATVRVGMAMSYPSWPAFRTPASGVYCYGVGAPEYISCIQTKTKTSVVLFRDGTVQLRVPVGFYAPPKPKLQVGQIWRRPKFSCVGSQGAVTCMVKRAGNPGFRLTAKTYQPQGII